jgi:tetratricopeptide (TPR) repeat protein
VGPGGLDSAWFAAPDGTPEAPAQPAKTMAKTRSWRELWGAMAPPRRRKRAKRQRRPHVAPTPEPIYPSLVRSWLFALWLSALVPVAAVSIATPARADFDPTGRGKKKPKPPKPAPGAPKPPKPAAGAPDDAAGRGPSQDALIARYTAIVLTQPSQPFPIQRLAQLYRERDGNLKKLVEDFEKRVAAGGADAWAARSRWRASTSRTRASTTPSRHVRGHRRQAQGALGHPGARRSSRPIAATRPGARAHYEAALPMLKVPADIEQTTRTLLTLDLDLKDFDGAKRYHEALVKTSGGVALRQGRARPRAALPRPLRARRGRVPRGGQGRRGRQPRPRACAARSRPRPRQAEEDDRGPGHAEARARGGGQRGGRALGDPGDHDRRLPRREQARRADRLLEAEKGQDFQRLALMGALYEETGEVDKAIAIYRKALGVDGKHIDTRLRLVHLLQTAGELDTAIKEYEALDQGRAEQPRLRLRALRDADPAGDRPKALKLLTELEARSARRRDPRRGGRFLRARRREGPRPQGPAKLAAGGGGDPQPPHRSRRSLLPGRRQEEGPGDLGAHQERGAEPRARRRHGRRGLPRSRHGRGGPRLAARGRSSSSRTTCATRRPSPSPSSARPPRRQPADPLRRGALPLGRALSPGPRTTSCSPASRARTSSACGASRASSPTRSRPLGSSASATPPDIEAGRLLAEVQRKLGRLPEAEATLRRVSPSLPGTTSRSSRSSACSSSSRTSWAPSTSSKKLVEADPKRAREFYQRMAQYAAELYRDDDAIKYAARAVELSPNDSSGHQKLGDMYRRRQDIPHAISEYRQAISQNDRLFPVYFDLAELLLSAGPARRGRSPLPPRGARLRRRRARRPRRAHEHAGQPRQELPDELERELLPVAVGNPQKTIYRRCSSSSTAR